MKKLMVEDPWFSESAPLLIAVMFLAIAVVWIYVGKALIFLAGGASSTLPLLQSVFYYLWPLPVFAIMLAIGYDQENDTSTLVTIPTKRFPRGRFVIGWAGICTALFFLLPIILNAASLLFAWAGFASVAQLLFEYRWLIQVIPPGIAFLGSVVALIIVSAYRYVKDNHRKPTDPDWRP